MTHTLCLLIISAGGATLFGRLADLSFTTGCRALCGTLAVLLAATCMWLMVELVRAFVLFAT